MFNSPGINNLKAVNNELGILNANIVGTPRVGYKQTNHSYGGDGAYSLSDRIEIPDQNLKTDHTSLDFQQGNIVDTGVETEFAISGSGFFLVQQIQDAASGATPNLLTRDGQFRFADIPALGGSVLVNQNGLVALRDTSGTGAGPYAPILQSDFKNNNFRPSVVNPDAGVDSLKFSKNGSTVFEFTGTVSLSTDSRLVQGSLEASNSDMAGSMVAMSLASKKFQAMAAQLKVEQNNLDTVINMIK